jgi:hypothetical protein
MDVPSCLPKDWQVFMVGSFRGVLSGGGEDFKLPERLANPGPFSAASTGPPGCGEPRSSAGFPRPGSAIANKS